MDTNPSDKLTVFIPESIRRRNDVNFGLLFGQHEDYESVKYVCITSFLPVSKEEVLKRPTMKKKMQLMSRNGGNEVIGFISSTGKLLSERTLSSVSRNKAVFVHLLKDGNKSVSIVDSTVGKRQVESSTIIHFDPEEIMSSDVLRAKYDPEVELNKSNKSHFCFPTFLIRSFDQSIFVLSAFKYCKLFCKRSAISTPHDGSKEPNISTPHDNNREVGNGRVKKLVDILCMTATGSQLLFKVNQIKDVVNYVHRCKSSHVHRCKSSHVHRCKSSHVHRCKEESGEVSWKVSSSLKVGNIVSSLMIDLLLGLLVTLILVRSFNISRVLELKVLELCESSADHVVVQLKELLYHLISMPAGLKLNRPLNESLGHFFLYHIYLWSTYMSLVKPVYDQMSRVIIYFGLFGLTFTISIITDLFSLATIHIYCFYGYAAKLFSFQIHGLISLWRLFRGKKWNQLKQRVDSYHYTNDQLFLGSILFTVLFFLLPTVLLYYSVFLFLRSLTLVIQFTLRTIIFKLSTLPAFALFHWILSSPKISSDVYIEILTVKVNDSHSQLFNNLHVRTTKLSLFSLSQTNPDYVKNPLMSGSKLTVGTLLKHILTGKIIYPL